jgi:undecaprenyl-diphosphatase
MLVLITAFGGAFVAGVLVWWWAHTWWPSDVTAPSLDAAAATHARRHRRMVRWVSARLQPDVATGSMLALVAAVSTIGGGAVGLVLAMVRTHRGFAVFDSVAARFGATHATPTSTHVLRLVTQFGGALLLVPITVVVGVVEARRMRSWATVAFLAIVVGGQYLLADIIKAVVDRARPDLLRLTGFSGPSFPSGHAVASSATFAAFALLVGRGRSGRAKALLAGASAAAAVLICATRVLLGVHWLTDVIAGVFLGWTWFAATSIAFGGRRLRFASPATQASLAGSVSLASSDTSQP